jgi:hypothetical protein
MLDFDFGHPIVDGRYSWAAATARGNLGSL